MINPKKILLITNYRKDEQQSMLRFGNLLLSSLENVELIDIEDIHPKEICSKIALTSKLKKWTSYIDKYVLFPRSLFKHLKKINLPRVVHIIDHSNSIYLKELKKFPSIKNVVTCHDLIAVRTAHREFHQAPNTSISGNYLQNWILSSLENADHFACDSFQTKDDLNKKIPKSKNISSVIYPGTETESTLEKKLNSKHKKNWLSFDPKFTNYILHVGSSAWYKNRKAVFLCFQHLVKNLPNKKFKLVLVGPKPQPEELDSKLSDWLRINKSMVHCLNNLSDSVLTLLYENTNAFVFPSHIEGFGWPPLEAALQRCPVITSATGAIENLLQDYAHYVKPNDQDRINSLTLNLVQNPKQLDKNIYLPTNKDCKEKYLNLYERMINN